MNDRIRVNLHCHSNQSDGEFSPAELAGRLASDGVLAAALTDHDTLKGLVEFQRAASRKGVACITGVEISVTTPDGGVLHLLGYGFDAGNNALQELLSRISPANGKSLWPHSLSSEMATIPSYNSMSAHVSMKEAIDCLHQAGGLAFWAHPIIPGGPLASEEVEPLLLQYKDIGLDGIEAFYCAYPERTRESLIILAEKHDMLISAGSDFHGLFQPGLNELGIDTSSHIWRRFRDAIMDISLESAQKSWGELKPAPIKKRHQRLQWRPFLFRIVFPVLLAIALFIFAIYQIVIPTFEQKLYDRKREMIRELTNLAVGILAEYDNEVSQGRMSLSLAQQTAAERIRELRYGRDGKDYFWVTDLHPRMILHPYRTDLNGVDLTDFKDQRGDRIFVEFVNVVKSQEDGYVEYVWQWKDNPERIEPKQSYLRKFKPWGWIVGTGIYVEDVENEIAVMESRMVHISLGITSISALLLVFVALQSMNIEKAKRHAEDELRESHEKYRTLVEAAADGILMILDGRCSYANKTMLEMLHYSESEIPLLDIYDIVTGSVRGQDADVASMIMNGYAPLSPIDASLRCKGGELLRVTLTATPISLMGKNGFTLAAHVFGGMQEQKQREAEREKLISELQNSRMFLYEPVSNHVSALAACDPHDSVSKAVALMSRNDSSSILVMTGNEAIGIVTDHDIRKRLVMEGLSPDQQVFRIMSSPLIRLGHQSLAYEAIHLMCANNISHLLVHDDMDRVLGILDGMELLRSHSQTLEILAKDIERAETLEEVVAARRNLPGLVGSLMGSGAKIRNTVRAITSVSDAVVEKLVGFALSELGPPPVDFAFLALGSEGRKEQTLVTDQDNAIVFNDIDEVDYNDAREYFLRFGDIVCHSLNEAGYAFCVGDIMARNPIWCQPLSIWKGYFSEWIRLADPKNILGVMTFFDFRVLHGKREFALELRRHISEQLASEPPFFLHYAQYSLLYKAPLGIFGNIIVESSRDHTFNIKEAMMPVINFARLYALRHGVQETNTITRLLELVKLGVLKQSFCDELTQVYDCLMQFRLGHQINALENTGLPNNAINPKTLTHMQEALLKEAFSQISNIQKKIGFDYFGSAQ